MIKSKTYLAKFVYLLRFLVHLIKTKRCFLIEESDSDYGKIYGGVNIQGQEIT